MVLLEPARSADPPISHGTRAAIALIIAPYAARVAVGLSADVYAGISESQPSGRCLSSAAVRLLAESGSPFANRSHLARHSTCAARPLVTCARICSRTSGGTWNGSSAPQ